MAGPRPRLEYLRERPALAGPRVPGGVYCRGCVNRRADYDPNMVPEVLAAIEARPPHAHLVVLSDFDGTLTSFDVDPSTPRLGEDTRRALERLAARQDVTVGLVSGRRVDDLAERTQLPGHVYLAGLHGLEIRHGDHAWRHPDLADSRDITDRVAAAIAAAVSGIPGVRLEHKRLSLTVHVRAVEPPRRCDALRLAREAAQPWLESGALKSLDASAAFELLPNIAWNKGDAVRWIVDDVESRERRKTWCIFFGDDVTDEDAFRAVRDGVTVVVGQRPSRAHLRLKSPADVAAVLSVVSADNGH